MIAEKSDTCLDPCGTPSERASHRRYVNEVFLSIGLYVALLLGCSVAVLHLEGAMKIVVSLLPMLGAGAMMVVLVRYVLRMDEMLRQTFVVCGAIAAVAVALATTALGLLETAGAGHISMTIVWPMLAVAFLIATPIVHRRRLG